MFGGFGKPVASTSTPGQAPAAFGGTSLFGQPAQNQQQQNQPGQQQQQQQQQQPQQQQTSLFGGGFGSTAPQGQSSSGLFGSTSTQPQQNQQTQQTSSLFGNFGGASQPNQTQNQIQSSFNPAASTSQPSQPFGTASLFTAPPQSQASTSQQPVLIPFQTPRFAAPREGEVRELDVNESYAQIIDELREKKRRTTYSFAVAGPRQDGKPYGNEMGLPDHLYAKASLENPNPSIVIAYPIVGEEGIKQKIEQQRTERERLQKAVDGYMSVVSSLWTTANQDMTIQRERIANKNQALRLRLMNAHEKLASIKAYRQTALNDKEEEMMQAVASAEKVVDSAGGGGQIKGRIHNDRAVIAQVKAARSRSGSQSARSGLSEEDVQQIGQILATQQKEIQVLIGRVKDDAYETNVVLKKGLPEVL